MVSEPNHHPTKRSLKQLLAVYINIGSAILRGRSVKVYEFWYNYIKEKCDGTKLCYIDRHNW